jgi:SWI/SNF-related matrix-associated actin-dependent regulator of chromatin subfamily A-like protein 1
LTLWKHQEEILPALKSGHFLLAWEPGCGKTRPLLEAGKWGRQLYLCPSSIRFQVAEEAVRYGVRTTEAVQIIRTGKDKVRDDAGLVIASYDLAATPAVWKQLFGMSWDSLVLDEGHMLKTPSAKRTRAVYGFKADSAGALFRRAEKVWVATGTPILNDPSEIWTHVSRLFPEAKGDCRTLTHWIERYCQYTDTPYGPKIFGVKNSAELQQNLSKTMSRLRKTDVLRDLPPLLVDTFTVEPQDIDLEGVPMDALEELQRLLREEPDDIRSIETLSVPLATLRRRIGLAKAKTVAEAVQGYLWSGGSGKVLVFYQHTDVGEAICDALRNCQPVLYQGGMTPTQREVAIKTFMKDPKCKVFVGQIQAAGTGLNLQVADRVFIAEPSWTPALNEQAIARAYRGGQPNMVHASLCVLKKSVDEDVTRVLVRKAKLVSEIVDGVKDGGAQQVRSKRGASVDAVPRLNQTLGRD